MKMRGKRAFAASIAVASLLVFAASAAAAAEIPFCTPGSGTGQCNNPRGVAVDSETGHVYVADRGNARVDVFESDGTSLGLFGAGELTSPTWLAVDNVATSASRHDVYVSNEFTVKKYKEFKATGELIKTFGKKGEGLCQLARANDPIAVGPGGNVYLADSYEDGTNNFVNRVIVFDPAGGCVEEHTLFEGQFETISNFAVDSKGNSYVTVEGAGVVIRKYSPSGALDYELDKGTESEGLTVDGADDLFAKQRGQRVTRLELTRFFSEYSPSGTILKRFGYAVGNFEVPGLAFFEAGLYASEGRVGVDYPQLPPPGPVVVPAPCAVKEGGLGNTNVTLQAEVNPEGKATNFYFEYVTQQQFEASVFAGAAKSEEKALPGATDFELHEAAVEVEGLLPETEYHCRLVSKNADSATATIGEAGVFKTRPGFEFGPAWSSGVRETSATLNLEGNPLGIPAKAQVEYVEDAKYKIHGFEEALRAPAEELNYEAGHEMLLKSVALSGLTPGTLYHYRLRAKNGTPPEGVVCPEAKSSCPELEHTFRTYLPEAGEVDHRGYELVSPGLKSSAEVAVPGGAAGFAEAERAVRIQAAAGSGEAATYTSWTSFGAAEGAPGTRRSKKKNNRG